MVISGPLPGIDTPDCRGELEHRDDGDDKYRRPEKLHLATSFLL